VQLIAELSTNHGGDVGLAEAMLVQAAEAGADYVKTQAYSLARLNPNDPQAACLEQSHLDEQAHARLMKAAAQAGVQYLSTPFDADALKMLRGLKLTRFKIASSEARGGWWMPNEGEHWFVSQPWGCERVRDINGRIKYNLTAIPLYPTPLECVSRAVLLDGYSDHCIGLSACEYAIARGAQAIEVHFKIQGKGRNCVWDKSAEDIKRLRDFANDVQTMTSGVATTFRNRWSA
jgi:N,N'-diacetyllegionaminate synthase